MRVDLLDPPAYSPPYDHAVAAALAAQGATVRLLTSRFAHGEAPAPAGYTREERFYRHATGPAGSASAPSTPSTCSATAARRTPTWCISSG